MGSNPVTFAGAVRASAARTRDDRAESTLFINAWNEWAEGASIEPSQRFGASNLASIADVYPASERILPAADGGVPRSGSAW
jgi:hypothetical protein